jgi:hypothetical protein
MRKIKLTKGLWALVDDEDFERINQFKWYASLESRGTKFYAVRWVYPPGEKRYKERMHHRILCIKPEELKPLLVVDHVNHDSLDNQKSNLEIVTQEENMRRAKGWKRKSEIGLVDF